MNYIPTAINGVYILEPRVFEDARGYFMETWRKADFDKAIGYEVNFIQDNQSKSSYGVLRGLHYTSQAKLVRVLQGCVVDVAVDLRRSSPTFGKYVAVELSDKNQRQLFIPRGFAHGFQVTSETAVFAYKVDNIYSPTTEASIRFDDPTLAIEWPIQDQNIIKLSDKDLQHSVNFEAAELFD